MNKKLILAALIAAVCSCQKQSGDPHKKCTEDKCRASIEAPKAEPAKEQAAVEVAAPAQAEVAAVAPEAKEIEVKVVEATNVVEAKKAE